MVLLTFGIALAGALLLGGKELARRILESRLRQQDQDKDNDRLTHVGRRRPGSPPVGGDRLPQISAYPSFRRRVFFADIAHTTDPPAQPGAV
jgi:hypothetical protein